MICRPNVMQPNGRAIAEALGIKAGTTLQLVAVSSLAVSSVVPLMMVAWSRNMLLNPAWLCHSTARACKHDHKHLGSTRHAKRTEMKKKEPMASPRKACVNTQSE